MHIIPDTQNNSVLVYATAQEEDTVEAMLRKIDILPLQVRIDDIEETDWGVRLNALTTAIAALVEAEVSRFPDEVGHVLGSRSLRSHNSLSGRLTYLAWKGRDAIGSGAAQFKKLIGQG